MKIIRATAAFLFALPSTSLAEVRSLFNPQTGMIEYQATIDRAPQIRKQEGFLLCWAASIQMIFAHYGHEVPQRVIVERIKGVAVDQSGWPIEMARALSIGWVDTEGNPFRASCRIYDALSGIQQFTNDDIIRELSAGRPLVYSNNNASHAMVLIGVNWIVYQNGQKEILGGLLADPSPFVPAVRSLNRYTEGRPTFAATVRISNGR
jgi:hypothetical protein